MLEIGDMIGETQLSSVPPRNSLILVSDPSRVFRASTAVLKDPQPRLVAVKCGIQESDIKDGTNLGCVFVRQKSE